MLNLICGRSGSGKTAKTIEMIKNRISEGKQTYLIVPEQQAFISESMLAFLPPSSALCFEVISFSRLCNIIFGVYGGIVDSATEIGARDLIMWQALRQISDELKEYKNVKIDTSLSSMMLSAVDELRANGITPEDCERAAEQCENDRLSDKLFDVALVYANYNRILSDRLGDGAAAAENKLQKLLSLLREHDYFKGSHVFVDSFTSFTGEEHAILQELALQADEMSITFCRDTETKNMPHTLGIDDTYRRFLRFAKDKGLKYEIANLDAQNTGKSRALNELESGLWNFSLTSDTAPKLTLAELSPIEAYECKNEFDEINLVALKILKAHKDGIKFSEMAVIFRDAESRKGLIEAIFEKTGIPYFISERSDLSASAAARLIFSAMRCVIYKFRLTDVITLLKTGLCGIDENDADLFEDYCYTWNISGEKFLEDAWSMNPDGYIADKPEGRSLEILLAANRVRSKLIPPLSMLRQELRSANGDTLKSCRAIYEYLSDIGLSRSLATLSEFDISENNDFRSAGENLRIYDVIVSVLCRISEILSDVPTTAEELATAIEIMLRGNDVGSVPAVGEYVTVGSAPTLRVENVKLAFVLGLCEGEFPRSYSDSGIFTENDKAALEELSIPLTSRETRVTSDELFYVYRAMTKPREKLIVSTLSSRIGGGACSPSTAWNRIRFLFPNLPVYHFDFDLIKKIANATDGGAPESIDNLSDNDILDTDNETCSSESDETVISPIQIKELFGDRLYLSQTKISTFASCPFQYWCKYVLSLREKKVSSVSYDSSGTIVHYVLEKLVEDLKNADGSLDRPDDDTVVKLVNSYVESYIGEIGCDLTPAMMYTFSRLRDLSLVMAKNVLDEFSDSSFKILAQEMRISDRHEGTLKPLEISIDENDEKSPKIVLGGIIDRLDYYDGEDRRYLRVVDYKTGHHPFDLEGLESGNDVQLPAYLFTAALEENKAVIGGEKEIFPASALFLSANETKGEVSPERSGFMLNDPELFRAASGSLDKKILAGIDVDKNTCEVKKGNAVDECGIKDIENTLRQSIACTGKSIFEGHAPRTPSKDACKYCFLRGGCPVAAKNTDH